LNIVPCGRSPRRPPGTLERLKTDEPPVELHAERREESRCSYESRCCWGVLAVASGARAVTLSLDPGGWTSSFTDLAVESILAPILVNSNPAGLPDTGTTPGATAGDSAAVMDYSLQHDGFQIGFTQTVDADVGSGSQGSAFLFFTPDENASYEVSGSFAVTDSEGRGVYLRTSLQDITGAPITLFRSEQHSESTLNEVFTVGLTEGDTSNVLEGSATGTLLAGRTYRFYADATLESWPSLARTTTADATGSITLSIPEPSLQTLLALAVGLGVLPGSSARGARRRTG
jgi:hypothetical protein